MEYGIAIFLLLLNRSSYSLNIQIWGNGIQEVNEFNYMGSTHKRWKKITKKSRED